MFLFETSQKSCIKNLNNVSKMALFGKKRLSKKNLCCKLLFEPEYLSDCF
jgi:hypothetical protein